MLHRLDDTSNHANAPQDLRILDSSVVSIRASLTVTTCGRELSGTQEQQRQHPVERRARECGPQLPHRQMIASTPDLENVLYYILEKVKNVDGSKRLTTKSAGCLVRSGGAVAHALAASISTCHLALSDWLGLLESPLASSLQPC